MTLRIKLLFILSAIVVGAAVLASTIVYDSACDELEQAAERQLKEDVALLAQLVQLRFESELRKFEYWAAMPLVIQTALKCDDSELVDAFRDYFASVVSREAYSSIFMINRAGDVVACDDPRRLYHPYAREVVSKKPGSLAGFAGVASIGESLVSVATGRPIATLTVPVWYEGQVVAILRTSIEMEGLREELLKPLNTGDKKRFYIFDPTLPEALPQGQELHAPTDRAPYQPPPAALRATFSGGRSSIFRYHEPSGEYLVASSTMEHPTWVFFVSQPMSEILAPIRTLRNITFVVIAVTLGLLIGAVLLLTAPTVRGIERCRDFSANIRRGRLDHRLQIKSNDEVGLLARDLNEMAAQIQFDRRALEDAERKYREIFENAVEGIFQTDEAGLILIANTRLAELLGATSPDDVIGRNALEFYADKNRRTELLALLQVEGEVSGFACEILRGDGSRWQALLHARAERNAEGQLSVIHGILEDVTERLVAAEQADRARKAEELLVRTELEMLRYQINPHFLFNAFNSLRELIITAPEDAVGMIESLAGFCRANLINQRDEFSTLGDELAHAEHYLQIEQIRFGKVLEGKIQAEDHIKSLSVPALIILPLVENAVKYGRRSKANPLRIQISVSLENSFGVITVANTGRWFEPGQLDDGARARLGIENVRRRLVRCHGQESGLSFEEKDGWVIVKARFPINGLRAARETCEKL